MKAYLEFDMPTNCAHCMMWSSCPALPNGEWPDYESILTNDVIGDGGAVPGIRHPDCPLIPIPEHGDLVERETIHGMVNWTFYKAPFSRKQVHEFFDGVPTIIPASKDDTEDDSPICTRASLASRGIYKTEEDE